MYPILYFFLFLKPSLKRDDIGEQVLRAIIGLILTFIVYYLIVPDRTLSFLISALWLPAVIQLIFSIGSFISGKEPIRETGFNILAFFLLFVLCIGYNLYPYITGGAKNLAKMVEVTESSEKVSKIDAQHVIVISPETAYYEMQKMLGTLPNPSIYRIGELGVTMIKDGAIYVAPIEIDGFFPAFSSGEIPGVIYVSAEKPSEAKVISVPSRVADSLLFSKDLDRYLRSYKKSAILFQANVELDDEGNPYYVGSYGHYKYGRKGPVIDGVLLVSFKDGKVTDYTKDKVPEWVDEIYPSDVSEIYNSYFGTLQDGLLNKLTTKKGVHIPTRWNSETSVAGLKVNSNEVTGVIDADGRLKWFTDHTNTSDASTTMTGYTLMDMRTGKVVYYKTPGYINGKGAMNAVDKSLGANKANWAPVQPLFYNLFGSEAWVVPVVNKSDGALVKIAIVAAKNGYVVIEDNKEFAIESFKNAIAYGKISEVSDKNANSVKAEEKKITGKVARINSVTEGGNTVFYVKLVGQDTIFMVNRNSGIDIVLTRDGDDVEIKYLDIKDNGIVSTTGFKNNSVK